MQNSAFLRVISRTKEIAVTSDNDDELAVLTREIADKTTYVQNQTIKIEVLEPDGHDLSGHERERPHLATRIARQFRFLKLHRPVKDTRQPRQLKDNHAGSPKD
ncbi:ABC-type lipopolysaccharide export system ATPase subunit [Bradyrhizobium sp. LB7.2]